MIAEKNIKIPSNIKIFALFSIEKIFISSEIERGAHATPKLKLISNSEVFFQHFLDDFD